MTKRDRAGNPLSLLAWAKLHSDFSYRLVAEDTANGHRVRTVWEGMDEPEGLPGEMFYIGIAPDDGSRFVTIATAATEDDALAHHRAALDLIRRESGVDVLRQLHAAFVDRVTPRAPGAYPRPGCG